jgi:multiple sugar transport system permease protein
MTSDSMVVPARSWRVLTSDRSRERLLAFAFVLPALLLFMLFSWWPILRGFVISFQYLDLINPPEWVGLDNFRLLFEDPLLGTAWLNTLYFAALGLLFGYLVPVALAIAMNEMRRGKPFFRLAFYLPVILPQMVSVLLWKWFYEPADGLINSALGLLGIAPLQWIHSGNTAMLSLVIMSTWANAGGTVLIYLAALQGVSPTLYEAAELDGAGIFQRIRHVTLPQIRNVMLIMLVLQIIGTMQVFTEPFVMTSGGPNYATTTVMLLLYDYAFKYFDFGTAGALGLVLFLVLGVFSLIYFRLTRAEDGGH